MSGNIYIVLHKFNAKNHPIHNKIHTTVKPHSVEQNTEV